MTLRLRCLVLSRSNLSWFPLRDGNRMVLPELAWQQRWIDLHLCLNRVDPFEHMRQLLVHRHVLLHYLLRLVHHGLLLLELLLLLS